MTTPDYWAVSATVSRDHPAGWGGARQVPTFYLSTVVQGITGEDHAHRVASAMLADLVDDPDAVLSVTVAPVGGEA